MLEIEKLSISFDTRAAEIPAVMDFSVTVQPGEAVGLVSESGCGKSRLAKMLIGLETVTEGAISLSNASIGDLTVEQRSKETIAKLQMVFQNPFDTLNPSMPVGAQIVRALETFHVGSNAGEHQERLLELLDLVKLPHTFAERTPRQLSVGQKQRVGIARAFAAKADVVVADEPVSALDVSVQAAVTKLLMDIQREHGTTLLFISHDLSIVRYLSDRVMVMYLGYIVELGETNQIFSPPYHPYTEALLSAVPIADTSVEKKQIVLEGDIPSALSPPLGCLFQTRCRWRERVGGGKFESEVSPLRALDDVHQIKCHLSADEFASMQLVISVSKT